MARKGAGQEVQTEQVQETAVGAISPEVNAVLNSLAQPIATGVVASHLQAYVQQWIIWILQSDDPEHQRIRDELIRKIGAALAAKTLAECLTGAIADQKQAFLTASEESA